MVSDHNRIKVRQHLREELPLPYFIKSQRVGRTEGNYEQFKWQNKVMALKAKPVGVIRS